MLSWQLSNQVEQLTLRLSRQITSTYITISLLNMHAQITKAKRQIIAVNKADSNNLSIYPMFCKIDLELNGRIISNTTSISRIAHNQNVCLFFPRKLKKPVSFVRNRKLNISGQMGVNVVSKQNAGLLVCTANFERSSLINLIGQH